MPDKVEVDPEKLKALLDKANLLGALMLEAETHHGGLIGSKTLTAANELRLELSRWK